MIKRDELCVILRRKLENVIGKDKIIKSYLQSLTTTYKIPSADIFGVITLRNDIEIAKDEYLYCICMIIDPELIKRHFTETEQKKYKNWKYSEKNKFKLPYEISLIQVTPSQWIGCIQVSELMKFGDAQMLYYNERTQRPLQHINHGEIEYWRPYINRFAQSAIEESFRNNTYIPNTITLNLPEGTVYEYNPEDMKLHILEIDHFDILDGYHRYRAMAALHNEDPAWDYPMELRIVAFQESKAQFFIYQEDQKTKMNRVASNSMNTNATQNKVVSRLNDDTNFYLGGQINNNDGVIDAGELGVVIGKLWFSKITGAKTETKLSLQVQKDIKTGLSEIVTQCPDLLERKWDKKFLYAVIYCIHNNTPINKLSRRSSAIYKRIKDDEQIFKYGYITKNDTAKMNKLLEEVS